MEKLWEAMWGSYAFFDAHATVLSFYANFSCHKA